MALLEVDISKCPREIRPGLAALADEYGERLQGGSGALKVSFAPGMAISGYAISGNASRAEIVYAGKTAAFRALGWLLGQEGAFKDDWRHEERPQFDSLGIMVDVSRNGVLTSASVEALLRRSALMGINTAMLYSEDTYEVPQEPFFGYLRGRYTHDELKAMDDYADALGIEMFPCIQALGHFEQVLQWPAYSEIRDTAGVLLAGEEKTYSFLERIIAAASAPFRSRRIHIGMDEAHGIGTGIYRQLHGERRPFDILNEHLVRVKGICDGLGLKPMIWSDMYFRLGSKKNEYYDRESVIPADVADSIPAGVELVYWDYYHTDVDFYEEWIDRHRAMGCEPIVAGGVWTWGRFWADLPFTLHATEACMKACRQKGIREVMVTMWGDDGMECDIFSALPGMQFFAEHGWRETVCQEDVAAGFRGSCNGHWHDWVKASGIDNIPGLVDSRKGLANLSKWLLWQDPLLSLMDPCLRGVDVTAHYAALAETLLAAAGRDEQSARLLFPAQIARVLSLKSGLRGRLAAAYTADDSCALQAVLEKDLPCLRTEVDSLWRLHRRMWLATYKPFGLEVIEQRYGGLRTRLESLEERLRDYLQGLVSSLPELEEELLPICDQEEGHLPWAAYARVKTPSNLK